jgi:hypothetical protein
VEFSAEIKPAGQELVFKWDGAQTVSVYDHDAFIDRFIVTQGTFPDSTAIVFNDVLYAVEIYLAPDVEARQVRGELPLGLPYAIVELTGPDATIGRLQAYAQTIKHCGDYGQTYWNHETGVAFFVGGDSDGDVTQGYTDFDEIRERFAAVPGVTAVEIEAEWTPPGADQNVTRVEDTDHEQTEGWVFISSGIEHYGPEWDPELDH